MSPPAPSSQLPIAVGDEVTPEDTAEAIKRLFATGFFDDVRNERDGGAVVVVVEERPSIATSTSPATTSSRPRICSNRSAGWGSRSAAFRSRAPGPDGAGDPRDLLRAGALLRGGRDDGDAARAPSGGRPLRDRRGRGGADPAHQHRRQPVLRRGRSPRPLRFLDPDLFSWLTGSDRYSKQKVAGTWSAFAPTTSTGASSISRSTPPRLPSPPTSASSTSPSTSRRERPSRSARSSSRVISSSRPRSSWTSWKCARGMSSTAATWPRPPRASRTVSATRATPSPT